MAKVKRKARNVRDYTHYKKPHILYADIGSNPSPSSPDSGSDKGSKKEKSNSVKVRVTSSTDRYLVGREFVCKIASPGAPKYCVVRIIEYNKKRKTALVELPGSGETRIVRTKYLRKLKS